MKTADECRKLAKVYQDQADRLGISMEMAAALRGISHTFSALAGQFEIVLAVAEEERPPQRSGPAKRRTKHTHTWYVCSYA